MGEGRTTRPMARGHGPHYSIAFSPGIGKGGKLLGRLAAYYAPPFLFFGLWCRFQLSFCCLVIWSQLAGLGGSGVLGIWLESSTGGVPWLGSSSGFGPWLGSSADSGPWLERSTDNGPWLESSSDNGLGKGRGRRKEGSGRGCEEVWVGQRRWEKRGGGSKQVFKRGEKRGGSKQVSKG